MDGHVQHPSGKVAAQGPVGGLSSNRVSVVRLDTAKLPALRLQLRVVRKLSPSVGPCISARLLGCHAPRPRHERERPDLGPTQ
jgi:hypothetical protein